MKLSVVIPSRNKSELLARTSPTLLDLGIAIAAGSAVVVATEADVVAMVDQGKCMILVTPTRWSPLSKGGFPPSLFED